MEFIQEWLDMFWKLAKGGAYLLSFGIAFIVIFYMVGALIWGIVEALIWTYKEINIRAKCDEKEIK